MHLGTPHVWTSHDRNACVLYVAEMRVSKLSLRFMLPFVAQRQHRPSLASGHHTPSPRLPHTTART